MQWFELLRHRPHGGPAHRAQSWSSLAIDNLVKGASGQAVQNMNIMNGFPGSHGIGDPHRLSPDACRTLPVIRFGGYKVTSADNECIFLLLRKMKPMLGRGWAELDVIFVVPVTRTLTIPAFGVPLLCRVCSSLKRFPCRYHPPA
ncbi:MAG: hypothetical protein MZU91_10350 [Desulfosudis oleivorans]|nr:hypothetical protein [Desulfosudis oleivorans]